MPAKIRLQRRGKKGQPFYHIVIADGRAPRDGRFIERIGTYNPLTRPADIQLDFDKALMWLQRGAQPTDTVRAILGYTGVLFRRHLLRGVEKGAISQELADSKFEVWKEEKLAKSEQKRKDAELKSKMTVKERLEAERQVNEKRAADINKKRMAELDALTQKMQKEAGTVVEEAPAVVEETPAIAEVAPTVVADETPEVVAEETPAVEAEEKPEVVVEDVPKVTAEEAQPDSNEEKPAPAAE